MTEDLRARLRADLGAERPPPLGDVVGAAIRDGRRLRRNRRLGTFGVSVAVAGAFAAAVVLVGDGGIAARPEPALPAGAAPSGLPPQNVPSASPVPTVPIAARTLTVHSGTVRAVGLQRKATSAAMLHLLTQLLPPGRTSHYAVAADDDLQVQLYLDDGDGPAMVRVSLDKYPPSGDIRSRGPMATVTIQYMPDNCTRSTSVDAEWPDGTLVRVDVATCLAGGPGPAEPSRPALSTDEAVRVATDPRWGVTMDERLVTLGAQRFPRLPAFAR